jgi:branched-chain amino acid transport system substrate-binding protein
MRFEGPKGAYTFRPDDHQALQPMYSARLVPHPTEPYCVPEFIREVSAEETTPPVVKPR